MKKIIALLLLSVMLLGIFCGCGEDKSNSDASAGNEEAKIQWLPFGLEFGQSYDSFCKVVTEKGFEAPELQDASANNGYLTKGIYEYDGETNFDWSFIESQTLTKLSTTEDSLEGLTYVGLMPSWAFSFNQNKELYEMYIAMYISNDDETEQTIVSEIIASLDKRFGTSGSSNASGEVLANYENDEMGATVYSFDTEVRADSKNIMVVLHNFEYATVTKE